VSRRRIKTLATALEEALVNASPAPWSQGSSYEQSDPGTYIASGNGLIVAAEQDNTDCVLRSEDARFMVTARNLLPALLEELRRL